MPAWPVVAIGTAWLLLLGGTDATLGGPGGRLLNLALLALAFGAWAYVARRDERWRPGSVLWPVLLVALLALVLTTLLSRNGRLSQEVLASAVILAGLYLLAREAMTDPRVRRTITGTVTVVAFAVSILYLLAVLARWAGWWLDVGAPAIPPLGPGGEGLLFGDPDTLAAVVVLGFAVGATHLAGVAGRRARWARRALTGLTTGAVIVSGSVVAWLALAATAVLLALAGGTNEAEAVAPGGAGRRRGRPIWRRLAAVGAIALMMFAVSAGPGIAVRWVESGEAAERATAAVVSARMLVGAPLTGVGPGAWADQRIPATEPSEVDAYLAGPGSGWLQAAVETGVVGLAALVFALLCVLMLVRSGLEDADPARRRWARAALAVVAYSGVHQLLGTLTLPAALAVVAVPIAWLDATETRPLFVLPAPLETADEWAADRVRAGLLGLGLSTLAIAIGWMALAQRPAMDADSGQSAFEANNWAGAIGSLSAAAAADPDIPAPLLLLGLAQARNGDAAGALATMTRLAEATDLPVAWMNRAWLEARAGDDVAARRSLNRALRLGGQQAQLALTAGWIHEQLGDLQDSTRWYVEALVLEPRAAGSGFWRSAERVARWDLIRSVVLERLTPGKAVDFWISAGDLAQATAVIQALPASPKRTLLERVISAWADEPGAHDALGQLARDNAQDAATVGWAARVAAHAGDAQATRRYRAWAATLGGWAEPRDAEVVVELPPISAAPKTGLGSEDWGAVTYRRPAPATQLLAEIPQLALAP